MAKEEISENLLKFLKGLNSKTETENTSVSNISKKLCYKESIIYKNKLFLTFFVLFIISNLYII